MRRKKMEMTQDECAQADFLRKVLAALRARFVFRGQAGGLSAGLETCGTMAPPAACLT
jgi:pyruvate-formate lyase-activating enzyme